MTSLPPVFTSNVDEVRSGSKYHDLTPILEGEAKRQALDEIATRQCKADEKRKEVERQQ